MLDCGIEQDWDPHGDFTLGQGLGSSQRFLPSALFQKGDLRFFFFFFDRTLKVLLSEGCLLGQGNDR